jgi:hypothetical protein
MKLNEKIHISLAIDSDNNTSFDLDPNEDLDVICPSIVKKYNLSQKVEKNLKKYIENFILEEIKKEKENKKILRQKAESSVNRLYNQSIQNEKKKNEVLKKLKNDKFEEFVNNFPFKPKIIYHKAYERNYDKIENKLIEDGKKNKEKQAIKRIAKEIDIRKKLQRIKSKDRTDVLNKSHDSSINDEKKYVFTSESLNYPQNNGKNNNATSNVLGLTFQQNNNFNSTPNYQILIFDENNKSVNKNLENSLLKNARNNNVISSNSINANNNFVNNNHHQNGTYLNNSNIRNSSKNITNLFGKNLDNSITRKEALGLRNLDSSITRKEALGIKNLDNSITRKEALINKINFQNNNPLANTIHSSSQSNKRYTEQYLSKNKNYTDTVHNLSMHQSSVSQKKNDSSVTNSQLNNAPEIKVNKEIIMGNRNSTTNQIIQNYNSAKKINKSISFGRETNRSKEAKEKIKLLSQEKIYSKKIIANKKNVISKISKEKQPIIYRFKTEKKKFNSNSIYENSKQRELAKTEHYKHIKSLEYSFRPVLTEASRDYISKSIYKHENKDDFFNRLSNSKRLKNLSLNLEKRNKSLQSITTPTSHKNGVKRSFSNKSNYTYTNKIATTHEETDLKSYKNTNTAGTGDKDESNRIRDLKQKKDLIENIKHQQYKEKKMLTNCTEKILDNINKFKLNNLKEIFEIIYNNCQNIDDIQSIENYGINSKIRDKLILPTCHIMKERNLEFNFQNFFLISNEIINFTIDD